MLSDARAGTACELDTGLEQERGITIRSAAITLDFRGLPPLDVARSLGISAEEAAALLPRQPAQPGEQSQWPALLAAAMDQLHALAASQERRVMGPPGAAVSTLASAKAHAAAGTRPSVGRRGRQRRRERSRGDSSDGASSPSSSVEGASASSGRSSPGAEAAPDASSGRVLHAGSLPREVSEATVATWAAGVCAWARQHAAGVDVEEPEVFLRRRRRFCWLQFGSPQQAASFLASTQCEPPLLGLDGSYVQVSVPGSTSRHALLRLCGARRLSHPQFSVTTHPDGDAGGFRASAILRMPDDLCRVFQEAEAPTRPWHATRRAAKEAAALAAIRTIRAERIGLDEPQQQAAAAAGAGEADQQLERKEGEAEAEAEAAADVSRLPPSEHLRLSLVDSPGHVDFSAEVSSALRLSDGAVVVVDAVEGVCAQTETVLRLALRERVRVVLLLNKADRLFLDLQLSAKEAMDTRLQPVIRRVNAIIAAELAKAKEQAEAVGGEAWHCPPVSLADGSVTIGSGYFGWAFNAHSIAQLCAGRARAAGEDPEAAASEATERFARRPRRAAVELGLEPVAAFTKLAVKGEAKHVAKLNRRLGAFGRPQLDPEEMVTLKERRRVRAALSRLMPVADAVIASMRRHLPCPLAAQWYRAPCMADASSATAAAIARCDPAGPALCFVSKMVPLSKQSLRSFYALGRVLSGTLRPGMPLQVWDGGAGADGTWRTRTVQRLVCAMAKDVATASEATAGQVIGVVGVDAALTGAGTLAQDPAEHRLSPLRTLRTAVEPVVRRAVRPKRRDGQSARRLADALRALAVTDPLARVETDPDSGESVVAGAGELHLEVCLHFLQEASGVELVISEPQVPYLETLTPANDGHEEAAPVATGKSANKHNRVSVAARPLDEALVRDLESGAFEAGVALAMRQAADAGSALTRKVAISQRLVARHGWDRSEAQRVWAFAPEPSYKASKPGKKSAAASTSGGGTGGGSTCLLVDCSVGVQGLSAVRDSIVSAFRQLVAAGPLAGRPVRGVRFDVLDAKVHGDSAHRGPGQVTPAAARAMRAALLAAQPRLLEPRFRLAVSVPHTHAAGAMRVLLGRGATLCHGEEEAEQAGGAAGGAMHSGAEQVVASLPVSRSFGVADDLRGATAGTAFPQARFGGWSVVPGELPTATPAAASKRSRQAQAEPAAGPAWSMPAVVAALRSRAGLEGTLPPAPADMAELSSRR